MLTLKETESERETAMLVLPTFVLPAKGAKMNKKVSCNKRICFCNELRREEERDEAAYLEFEGGVGGQRQAHPAAHSVLSFLK